jgi:predicted nuclease of predicted toxin-antitoxin system
MKILIDEQLPTKLKSIFSAFGYEVFTVRDMKWLGTKNGELLKLMTINNFNVLLTNDKNLYYQQKISTLKVCIVNIDSKTNRYDDVFEIMGQIKNKLEEVENYLLSTPGGYFIVSKY